MTFYVIGKVSKSNYL